MRSQRTARAALLVALLLALLATVGSLVTFTDTRPDDRETVTAEGAADQPAELQRRQGSRPRVGDQRAARGSDEPTDDPDPDRITLIVTSDTTGRPVPEIAVWMSDSGLALTDARGEATMRRPSETVVRVRTIGRSLFADYDAEHALGDPTQHTISIELQPLGQVRTVVVDGVTGAPVPRARVRLIGNTDQARTIIAHELSDADGAALLGGGVGTRATLQVRLDGFMPEEREIEVGDDRAPAERVELHRGGTLTGSVLTSNGEPARGATVRIVEARRGATLQLGASEPGFQVAKGDWLTDRVDSEGAFHIADVRARTRYVAMAIARDGRMSRPSPPFTLADGAPPIELPPDGTLLVSVRVGGQPAPEGTSIEHIKDRSVLSTATRGEDGRFRLTGLPPYNCQLRICVPHRPPAFHHIVVAPGTVTIHTVDLPEGLALRGVVRSSGGEPLRDARVTVRQNEEKVQVRSESDGSFEVLGLEPGIARCRVTAPEHVRLDEEFGVPGPAHSVQLTRKGVLVLRVRPPANGSIPKVRVRTERLVVSEAEGNSERWIRAMRILRFRGGVADVRFPTIGPSRIIVLAEGYAPIVREASPTSAQVLDLGEVAISSGLELTGTVRNERGEPIAGVVLQATQEHALRALNATADAEGRFRFAALMDAPVEIVTQEAKHAASTVSIARPTEGLQIELASLCHLAVDVIMDTDKREFNDLNVIYTPVSTATNDADGTREIRKRLRPSKGRVGRFEGYVPAGRWRITTTADQSTSVDVELSADTKSQPIEIRVD